MQTFSPSRLEAFSDGVIAVIITIMVLELKVPADSGPIGLWEVAPAVAVYALSFGFVGIYWVNHHLLVHRIRHASPRILWANLVWLFCLSLVPFLTAYVVEKREDSFSVSLYAAWFLVTAFGFMLLRLAVAARQYAEGSLEHTDHALARKHWGSLAAYVACIPLAYWRPIASLALVALVTAIWIIPTLGVETCEDAEKSSSR
jgi:uncharacterized membrane protein